MIFLLKFWKKTPSQTILATFKHEGVDLTGSHYQPKPGKDEDLGSIVDSMWAGFYFRQHWAVFRQDLGRLGMSKNYVISRILEPTGVHIAN